MLSANSNTIATVIVCETEESDFADSAIEELKKANIACYRTGGSLHLGQSDPTVCIHVSDDADVSRANQILISNGAAIERSLQLPSGWTAWSGIDFGLLLLLAILAWLLR